MHRLFVALRPPPAIRQQLLAAMGGLAAVRWQCDAQLHHTLRFIGEVERAQAEDVAAALVGVTGPRPTFSIRGAGTFDRKGVVHTIWAGVAADDALDILRCRINRALARVGIPVEQRAFQPHITLARGGRGVRDIPAFLAGVATLKSEVVPADAFLLYESLLANDGPSYHAIARYPLS